MPKPFNLLLAYLLGVRQAFNCGMMKRKITSFGKINCNKYLIIEEISVKLFVAL
jgi:hypothetical protein